MKDSSHGKELTVFLKKFFCPFYVLAHLPHLTSSLWHTKATSYIPAGKCNKASACTVLYRPTSCEGSGCLHFSASILCLKYHSDIIM